MDKPQFKTWRPDWEKKCNIPAISGPGRHVRLEDFEKVVAYYEGLLKAAKQRP